MQLQHFPEMFRFRLALQVGFVMMIVKYKALNADGST
jgi:hypothetical protein